MTSFRDLHRPGEPFILANAWDMGSARMMAALGAKAIATTSAGHAFTIGRPDMGQVTREEALDHAFDLVQATPLPVNGDLENGYGPTLDDIRKTIEMADKMGLAGAGIEDTALPSTEPYPFNKAVERIEVAVETARGLTNDFVLTARADGVLNGMYDLDEALKRAKAFEAAGADVIYIPLLTDLEQVKRVCGEISVPVNVLAAGPIIEHGVSALAQAGAARISIGSMLARLTHRTIMDSCKQMFEEGEFGLFNNVASGKKVDALLEKGGS